MCLERADFTQVPERKPGLLAGTRSLIGLHQSQLAKDAGVDTGTVSRMEAAGKQSARGLARNVEAVVLALEKRGVEITETGVQLTGKRRR